MHRAGDPLAVHPVRFGRFVCWQVLMPPEQAVRPLVHASFVPQVAFGVQLSTHRLPSQCCPLGQQWPGEPEQLPPLQVLPAQHT